MYEYTNKTSLSCTRMCMYVHIHTHLMHTDVDIREVHAHIHIHACDVCICMSHTRVCIYVSCMHTACDTRTPRGSISCFRWEELQGRGAEAAPQLSRALSRLHSLFPRSRSPGIAICDSGICSNLFMNDGACQSAEAASGRKRRPPQSDSQWRAQQRARRWFRWGGGGGALSLAYRPLAAAFVPRGRAGNRNASFVS